jgi:hypothetical protein
MEIYTKSLKVAGKPDSWLRGRMPIHPARVQCPCGFDSYVDVETGLIE